MFGAYYDQRGPAKHLYFDTSQPLLPAWPHLNGYGSPDGLGKAMGSYEPVGGLGVDMSQLSVTPTIDLSQTNLQTSSGVAVDTSSSSGAPPGYRMLSDDQEAQGVVTQVMGAYVFPMAVADARYACSLKDGIAPAAAPAGSQIIDPGSLINFWTGKGFFVVAYLNDPRCVSTAAPVTMVAQRMIGTTVAPTKPVLRSTAKLMGFGDTVTAQGVAFAALTPAEMASAKGSDRMYVIALPGGASPSAANWAAALSSGGGGGGAGILATTGGKVGLAIVAMAAIGGLAWYGSSKGWF